MGVFKWMQTILKAIFYNIKFGIELSDDTKNVEVLIEEIHDLQVLFWKMITYGFKIDAAEPFRKKLKTSVQMMMMHIWF
jgi:hypothetical protein